MSSFLALGLFGKVEPMLCGSNSNFPTTFAEIKFLWGRNRIIFPWQTKIQGLQCTVLFYVHKKFNKMEYELIILVHSWHLALWHSSYLPRGIRTGIIGLVHLQSGNLAIQQSGNLAIQQSSTINPHHITSQHTNNTTTGRENNNK